MATSSSRWPGGGKREHRLFQSRGGLVLASALALFALAATGCSDPPAPEHGLSAHVEGNAHSPAYACPYANSDRCASSHCCVDSPCYGNSNADSHHCANSYRCACVAYSGTDARVGVPPRDRQRLHGSRRVAGARRKRHQRQAQRSGAGRGLPFGRDPEERLRRRRTGETLRARLR